MKLEVDPLYAEARSVLLDALDALKPHLEAIIVVGAQAVYLRTGPLDIPIAPFTTDGDLALDPARLGKEPHLAEAMRSAGFRQEPDGKPEPGTWVTRRVVEGRDVDLPVDLIVPTDLAPSTGRRGARLGLHGKAAARKIPGLEAAVLDNNVLEIVGIGQDEQRVVEAKVAGVAALLIAKAHKIQERLQNTGRPDRLVDKDAGDVFRLMQTSDARKCGHTVGRLMEDRHAGVSVRFGIQFLIEQFRGPASGGTSMAIDYFRGAIPEGRVQVICTTFISELQASLGAA